MLGLAELEHTKAYQEGHQEGHQEGRHEEALTFLLRILPKKIGSLDPSHVKQIEKLSVAELETLGEDLLDFSLVVDLDRWLQRQKRRSGGC